MDQGSINDTTLAEKLMGHLKERVAALLVEFYAHVKELHKDVLGCLVALNVAILVKQHHVPCTDRKQYLMPAKVYAHLICITSQELQPSQCGIQHFKQMEFTTTPAMPALKHQFISITELLSKAFFSFQSTNSYFKCWFEHCSNSPP